ncbi:hypothetical protein LCGC14_1005870 [marine sediment metagenome]|uniref:Calcineurin-like phosphoesterase domain-containing protein n=1 Tax=marine sediment metagenome TaxID=412755 RepID=A0A0F9R7T6_9ZZZZ
MISDTHTFEKELDLPDADLLIHAGDFTLMGNPLEVYHFNEWLGTQKQFNDKIVIAGNHDKCVGEDPMFGYKQLTNATYLQNSGVQIDDMYFWGSPMTPSFNGMRQGLTFFTNGDKEAKKAWAGMPKKTDFLITHGPPHGILDEVCRSISSGYNIPEGSTYKVGDMLIEHCGDKMLLDKVRKVKPKYHVFGHIHSGHGIKETDTTMFINASVVDDAYGMCYEPTVIYI